MEFTVKHSDPLSRARVGRLVTAHGVVPTPIFMPVGTLGSVKGVHQRELMEDLDAKIILGNTYHLFERPGLSLLQKAGGLHRFIGWDRPMLTDSGGYQVYSLAHQRKITEEGVTFKSYLDGSKYFFSPEGAVDMQRMIGADIMMAFDECTPFPCTYEYAKRSMERTHRWLERCLVQLDATPPLYGYQQVLFPIVQGGIYKDLRIASTAYIASKPSVGYAIGGVCHPTGQLYEVTSWVTEGLPKDSARYLMGVGTPEDLLESIALGVDMFDCVMPARNGRNGMLFTSKGRINIKNKKWREDFSPIDSQLGGYASTAYSKAYLHHLIRCGERLGGQIATLHNLRFYLWLVDEARKQIVKETFSSWKNQMVKDLKRRR